MIPVSPEWGVIALCQIPTNSCAPSQWYFETCFMYRYMISYHIVVRILIIVFEYPEVNWCTLQSLLPMTQDFTIEEIHTPFCSVIRWDREVDICRNIINGNFHEGYTIEQAKQLHDFFRTTGNVFQNELWLLPFCQTDRCRSWYAFHCEN